MITSTTSRTAPIATSLILGLFVAAAARSLPVGAADALESPLGGRDSYGLLVGLNLAAFGVVGPASASAVARWGWRRVAASALLLCALGLAAGSSGARGLVIVGLGPSLGAAAGLIAVPVAVTICEARATRHRGLVVGALTAACAIGQIAALPLVALAVSSWGRVVMLLAASVICAIAALLVAIGPCLRPPIAAAAGDTERRRRPGRPIVVLGAVFFACGATTTGIVGTHLVPAAHDHGISAVAATSALAAMGALTLVGSLASGWLSDRHDPRQLLFALYVIRGISLFFLPFALQQRTIGLAAFVIVFGLDWAASVPPVVALTREIVGPGHTGRVVGWLFVAHHGGAALAAWGAGVAGEAMGNYVLVFFAAGLVSVAAAIAAWSIPGGVRAHRSLPVGAAASASRPAT